MNGYGICCSRTYKKHFGMLIFCLLCCESLSVCVLLNIEFIETENLNVTLMTKIVERKMREEHAQDTHTMFFINEMYDFGTENRLRLVFTLIQVCRTFDWRIHIQLNASTELMRLYCMQVRYAHDTQIVRDDIVWRRHTVLHKRYIMIELKWQQEWSFRVHLFFRSLSRVKALPNYSISKSAIQTNVICNLKQTHGKKHFCLTSVKMFQCKKRSQFWTPFSRWLVCLLVWVLEWGLASQIQIHILTSCKGTK